MISTVSESFFLQKLGFLDLFFGTFSPRWLPPRFFSKKKFNFSHFWTSHSPVGNFPTKMLDFKRFKNPQWEIFQKNCSKTRIFEQNIGQISHCAYQNSKNWTFFPLPFRHEGLNLRFYQKKKKTCFAFRAAFRIKNNIVFMLHDYTRLQTSSFYDSFGFYFFLRFAL